MNEYQLTGKTLLITGASSGIGRETALQAARCGASLVITGRDNTRLSQTRDALELQPGATIQTFIADLTVEQELNDLVPKLPLLDGLVHCAGIVGPLPVKFITNDDINRMFSINYQVPVLLTSLILRKRKLADGASVLFMSSIATRNPYFGGALYSSSKAALEAYSRTLALEMVGKGIRSNFIQAGLVETPMIESPAEEGMKQEALERYLKRYPLGIGKPADVAQAILFFMSDASRWVTGTSLIMGGE
jgi:NAD(P)-dependent dehydrogenase (short-subunit alcohol dehydrogenase family)